MSDFLLPRLSLHQVLRRRTQGRTIPPTPEHGKFQLGSIADGGRIPFHRTSERGAGCPEQQLLLLLCAGDPPRNHQSSLTTASLATLRAR